MSRPNGARAAALLLAVLAGLAVAAPLVAGHAPDAVDLAARRQPPSVAHWLGTDDLGRDLWARTVHGARVSLAVGVLAALVGAALGGLVGGLAGAGPRWLDRLLMRATDAALMVPRLPLLMLLGAAVAPGLPLLVLLVGAVGWMEPARVVRGELRAVAAREYVTAARALGVGDVRLLLRHLAPAVGPVLAVATTLAVGRAMLLESALSFFGVGVQPPTASWGNMLYQAQNALTTTPWLAVGPGAMIFLTVLAVNALGDGLAEGRRTAARRTALLLLAAGLGGPLLAPAPLAAQAAADTAPLPPAARRALLRTPTAPHWRRPAPDTARLELVTSKGTVVIELIRAWSPAGVDRVVQLARAGFFDDTRLYRVLATYIAQFGLPADPVAAQRWRTQRLPVEAPRERNRRGTLAFAQTSPRDRATDLFINLRDNANLDSLGFTPVGRVIEGMEVADQWHFGYGDLPSAPAPVGDPRRFYGETNRYLDREFPKLDRILTARVRAAGAAAASPPAPPAAAR